jgi:hypothetical protein
MDWKNNGPIQGRYPEQYEIRIGERVHWAGANYIVIKGPDAKVLADLIMTLKELAQ